MKRLIPNPMRKISKSESLEEIDDLGRNATAINRTNPSNSRWQIAARAIVRVLSREKSRGEEHLSRGVCQQRTAKGHMFNVQSHHLYARKRRRVFDSASFRDIRLVKERTSPSCVRHSWEYLHCVPCMFVGSRCSWRPSAMVPITVCYGE